MTEADTLASAILHAVQARLGWSPETLGHAPTRAALLRTAQGEKRSHLLAESPSRIWARPRMLKGGAPSVGVTVFWGNDAMHMTLTPAD